MSDIIKKIKEEKLLTLIIFKNELEDKKDLEPI
jgi:hypothetical protein